MNPWIASSWLYDAFVAIGYKIFDLRFVLALAVLSRLALAITVFVLGGGLRGRFWTAVLLSAAAQCVLGSTQPLPVYGSMLAYATVLGALFAYRRSGNLRLLYPLPVVFLLWANFHEQFVFGVIVLLLFVITCIVERKNVPSIRSVISIAVLSLLATICTPYGWKPYSVFFADVTSLASPYFADHLALHFRSPQDYLLLLLTMSAFLVLGLRRSRDIFQIALMVGCSIAAFHAQRDVWLVALAAVAVIAVEPIATNVQMEPDSQALIPATLAIVLILVAVAVNSHGSHASALNEISYTYPVRAADYIRDHHLPQPIFNTLVSGGFLAWYLPEYPVAIDGRTDLYGAEYNIAYGKVMNAEEHYSTFAPLNRAGTLVIEKKSLMAAALASVPEFKTVYSDHVALVLVRESMQ